MDAHEAAQMHQNFSQQLLQDHIEACSLPEHNLITVSNLHLLVMSALEGRTTCFAFLWYPFEVFVSYSGFIGTPELSFNAFCSR